MRRVHLVLFAVVLGLLALPASAPAKEVSEVQVCGSHDCTTYDTSDFKSLMFLAQDAGPTDPPAAPAPWYRVRFTVDERENGGGYDRWTVAYVPSADRLRVRDDSGGFTWVALNPRAAAVFRRAARSLPALPRAPHGAAGRAACVERRRARRPSRRDVQRLDAVGLDRHRRNALRGARGVRSDRAPPAPRPAGRNVSRSTDIRIGTHRKALQARRSSPIKSLQGAQMGKATGHWTDERLDEFAAAATQRQLLQIAWGLVAALIGAAAQQHRACGPPHVARCVPRWTPSRARRTS